MVTGNMDTDTGWVIQYWNRNGIGYVRTCESRARGSYLGFPLASDIDISDTAPPTARSKSSTGTTTAAGRSATPGARTTAARSSNSNGCPNAPPAPPRLDRHRRPLQAVGRGSHAPAQQGPALQRAARAPSLGDAQHDARVLPQLRHQALRGDPAHVPRAAGPRRAADGLRERGGGEHDGLDGAGPRERVREAGPRRGGQLPRRLRSEWRAVLSRGARGRAARRPGLGRREHGQGERLALQGGRARGRWWRDVAWASGNIRGWDEVATACKDGLVRVFKVVAGREQGAESAGGSRGEFEKVPDRIIAPSATHVSMENGAKNIPSGIGRGLAGQRSNRSRQQEAQGRDGAVMHSAKEISRLEAARAPVWKVEFDADGQLLGSMGDDGKLMMWRREPNGLWSRSAELGMNRG
ncbi:hypothetical protein EYC84_011486 [Monilinia fructicola]|uniref:Uncharacterized protein n=1 Tax=Monilinia fructicola TaxID=38448 RepID=A0A5M9J6Z5_MONFR|nr:hypothetical protein EYC84_011486 [Monilinia fructicola]